MKSVADELPLWMRLQELCNHIAAVRRLDATQQRIDYWHGSEMHHVPTMVLCLHGQARIIYEGKKRIDLNSGEALIIAPGVFHQHERIGKQCMVLMQGLTPRHSDFNMSSNQAHIYGCIPLNRVEKTFYRIIEEPMSKQTAWIKAIKDICKSILHEHAQTGNAIPSSFNKMFTYFVRYVYDGISAEDIIAKSGLCRSRAYAIWTEHYGRSLRDSICQQRLYLAKLLLSTNTSINDIAERCGFASRQQMTRLFQKQESCSPRQWRQLQQQHQN